MTAPREFIPSDTPNRDGFWPITDDEGFLFALAVNQEAGLALVAATKKPAPEERKVNVLMTGLGFIVLLALLFGSFAAGRAHGEEALPPRPIDPRAPLTVALADRMAGHAFRVGIGSALDLFTTSLALHLCPKCGELNPGGWDSEARISLKLAVATFVLAWDWLLEKWNRSGWARALSYGFLGESGGFAANNTLHAIRRR